MNDNRAAQLLPELEHSHCWKCFKDQSDRHLIDEIMLQLCRGCYFELRTIRNFLAAQGIVLRASEAVKAAMEAVASVGDGIERVVKGEEEGLDLSETAPRSANSRSKA